LEKRGLIQPENKMYFKFDGFLFYFVLYCSVKMHFISYDCCDDVCISDFDSHTIYIFYVEDDLLQKENAVYLF